jgi:tRNA pseudouridine38-40 synthase
MLKLGMQRYFIELSYDGGAYHGWQRQPNAYSVQQELEQALERMLGCEVPIVGQGRTDTGVHAKKSFAHFDFDGSLPDKLEQRLNGYLPQSLGIHRIVPVLPEAHARFSALSRSYEYHLHARKSPLLYGRSMLAYPWPDVALMNEAAAILLSYQDFACFARSGGGQQTTLCSITKANWAATEHEAVFTITANRFLRNMVRAIVGTLLEIGRGKRSLESLHKLLKSGKRTEAGQSVPGHGLYLTDVHYPSRIYADN